MRRKRILIIDNESIELASARRTLQDDGYEVFSHSKGFSATEIARQLEPDLILLDIRRRPASGSQLDALVVDDEDAFPAHAANLRRTSKSVLRRGQILCEVIANRRLHNKCTQKSPALYILRRLLSAVFAVIDSRKEGGRDVSGRPAHSHTVV